MLLRVPHYHLPHLRDYDPIAILTGVLGIAVAAYLALAY